MSANSKIEWTDHTFNPWIGCTKVSPACDHCYAEVSTPSRTLGVEWGAGQPRRRTSPSNWALPLRWNAQAQAFHAQHGRRQRVFCASLADWLDNEVPIEWFIDLLDLIRSTPHLDWLLLSKRIGNFQKRMREALEGLHEQEEKNPLWFFIYGWIKGDAPAHVWIGATIPNQPEADRDIPKLLAVPARVRFLSMEPLLGPVYLTRVIAGRYDMGRKLDVLDVVGNAAHEEWTADSPIGARRRQLSTGAGRVDWVIVGGESGPNARPMHPDWVRDLRDQCKTARVPFLFKQWGEWIPADQSAAARQANGFSPIREFFHLDNQRMHRVGKKAAGRLLDGVQHDGVPS